jgi:RNA polymerase sigma-70 factor (ECF subfamily)
LKKFQIFQRIGGLRLSYRVKQGCMVETEEERDWVKQSLQGDDAAFAALVLRYQHMIYSVAYRMTGSLAEAEDLTQEAFVQAFRQLSSYRAEARFSSWLYRIALNQCLNWQKRRQRIEMLHTEWGRRQEMTSEPETQQTRLVQEALLKLNPKQRAAIILTTYDGLSHAQAARVLGCSETTVSWRVFAARAKLKRILGRQQEAKNDE